MAHKDILRYLKEIREERSTSNHRERGNQIIKSRWSLDEVSPQADVESVRRARILPVSGRKLLIPRLKRARSRNLKRIFDSSRGSIVPIIRQSEGKQRGTTTEILLRTLGRHLHRSGRHFCPFCPRFLDRNEKREDWRLIKILDFVYHA